MIFLLAKSIKEYLEASLAELYQHEPGGGWSVPQVFIGGDLPPKVQGEPEKLPYVLVYPSNGSDNELAYGEVDVTLVFGGFTTEDIEAGFNEIINLISRVRLALLKLPNLILNDRYELKLPLTWRMGGQDGYQPHPMHVASMRSQWGIQAWQNEGRVE